MATPFTIPQILSIARLCQPLTVVAIQKNLVFQGGDLNSQQALLIYLERKAVENRYNLNPADPTLPATANYLFSLLRGWPQAWNTIQAITGGLPTISNPASLSKLVGESAVFSVTVTSAGAYTVQWYRNGVLIPGATGLSYTLSNVQLTDSGALFSAVATNAAGNAASLPAALTVSSSLTAKWWYGPDDPYAALSAGTDDLVYQVSQTITHNAAIAINYPAGAENQQYNVLRYPTSENDKATWKNTDLNQGNIPDSDMRGVLNINGFKYIVSRVAMNLDATTTTITYT